MLDEDIGEDRHPPGVEEVEIQIDWDKIPGLAESVGKPGTGVCSNYSYDTVDSTWEAVRNLKGGRAIFTHPDSSIKCGGAPQKSSGSSWVWQMAV